MFDVGWMCSLPGLYMYVGVRFGSAFIGNWGVPGNPVNFMSWTRCMSAVVGQRVTGPLDPGGWGPTASRPGPQSALILQMLVYTCFFEGQPLPSMGRRLLKTNRIKKEHPEC